MSTWNVSNMLWSEKIAIVDGGGGGGGAAVNKELRREVGEISPRRPFLPTTDGGGGYARWLWLSGGGGGGGCCPIGGALW